MVVVFAFRYYVYVENVQTVGTLMALGAAWAIQYPILNQLGDQVRGAHCP